MWIIKDWANNVLFDGREFETFEDGWDFLGETFPDVHETHFDDYFVVEVE